MANISLPPLSQFVPMVRIALSEAAREWHWLRGLGSELAAVLSAIRNLQHYPPFSWSILIQTSSWTQSRIQFLLPLPIASTFIAIYSGTLFLREVRSQMMVLSPEMRIQLEHSTIVSWLPIKAAHSLPEFSPDTKRNLDPVDLVSFNITVESYTFSNST